MADQKVWEQLKVDGGKVAERLKELVSEGNARRIVIKQKGRTVAEFPLTIGLVGAVLAPFIAAVAAFAALLSHCSIEVERVVPKTETKTAKRSRRPPTSR